MKFISSAVKVMPTSIEDDVKIYTGLRHVDCWEKMRATSADWKKMSFTDGFLVGDDEKIFFVNRQEGAKIAKELGYILEYDKTLYSEDIWPE